MNTVTDISRADTQAVSAAISEMLSPKAIDISPEACAARAARIKAANAAHLERARKLSKARELTREAQLHDELELLTALQNVHDNIKSGNTLCNEYAARLLELITDLDAELREGEPELPDFRKVGELDCYSPRSVR